MKGASYTINALFILGTMLSFASAGSNYRNLENFKLMTLQKTSKVFYTGKYFFDYYLEKTIKTSCLMFYTIIFFII